jgi:hypothetical protein
MAMSDTSYGLSAQRFLRRRDRHSWTSMRAARTRDIVRTDPAGPHSARCA